MRAGVALAMLLLVAVLGGCDAIFGDDAEPGVPEPTSWQDVFTVSQTSLQFEASVVLGGAYFPVLSDDATLIGIIEIGQRPDGYDYGEVEVSYEESDTMGSFISVELDRTPVEGGSPNCCQPGDTYELRVTFDLVGFLTSGAMDVSELWATGSETVTVEDALQIEFYVGENTSGGTYPNTYFYPLFSFSEDLPIALQIELTQDNPIPPVAFEPAITLDAFEEQGGLAFADLDGDGDLDGVAAVAGGGIGTCRSFENIGNAQSPVWVRNDVILGDNTEGCYTSFSFGDLDGDGDLDRVESFGGPGYRNNGTPNSPMFEIDESLVQGLSGGAGFHLTDIDGDGDLDILHSDLSFAWENVGSVLSPIWSKSPALMSWADALIGIVGSDVDALCVRPLVPAVGQQVVLAGGSEVCIAMLENAGTSGGPVDLVDYRCLQNVAYPGTIHCLDFSGDGLPDLGVDAGDAFKVYFQTP